MADQCNRCRFWLEDESTRDEFDADGSFGFCRRRPPVIIGDIATKVMPALRYGFQEDPEMDATTLMAASLWPAIYARSWCGEFESRETRLASPC